MIKKNVFLILYLPIPIPSSPEKSAVNQTISSPMTNMLGNNRMGEQRKKEKDGKWNEQEKKSFKMWQRQKKNKIERGNIVSKANRIKLYDFFLLTLH